MHKPMERPLENPLDKWLLSGSGLCSAIYFATKSWQPYPGSIVLKVASIATLALFAWLTVKGWDGKLLTGALALSALGDLWLDLPGNYFVQGLGAFLLAHLVYVALFVRQWPRLFRLGTSQLAGLTGLGLYGIALTFWLWPGLGAMRIPVMAYNGAISAMVASAIIANFQADQRRRWIVVGALLFLLSDSLIGINRFRTPVPGRDYLVWSTYYLAQLGITIGFWLAQPEKNTREK